MLLNRGFPATDRSGGLAPALHGQGDIRLAQVLRLAQDRCATCTRGLVCLAPPVAGAFVNSEAEPAVGRTLHRTLKSRNSPPSIEPYILRQAQHERWERARHRSEWKRSERHRSECKWIEWNRCEWHRATAGVSLLPLPRRCLESLLRSAAPRRRTCQRDQAFPAPGRARRWLSSPARRE